MNICHWSGTWSVNSDSVVDIIQIGIACPAKDYRSSDAHAAYMHWLGQYDSADPSHPQYCEICVAVAKWREDHEVPNTILHSGVLPRDWFSEPNILDAIEKTQAIYEALA